jgi:hypothetical protein
MARDRDTTPSPMASASILEHFARLPDPRREHGQIHRLDEIVFMAICGVLCGADSWQEIADYCDAKLDWLSTFLALPGGVPSHDTFRRVFCLLDPVAFQACFFDWMTALMARHGLTPAPPGRPELRPVAIDGKTQRGSARRTVGRSPLHLVSAWAVENHLTLGQVATDAKSNEITAIPELLKLLDLEGAVVTIDAMGCQKDIAAGIVQGKGEYVLAVKENQPHLYEDIGRAFDEALEDGEPGVDFAICQTEGVHGGRQEIRTCCVITNPSGIRDMGLWTKLTAICMVTSERARARWGREPRGPLFHRQRRRHGGGVFTVGARPLGDREHVALGAGCLLPRRRPTPLGRQQRGEPGLDPKAGALLAQSGADEQSQEHQPTTSSCRLERGLLAEGSGSNTREK